MNLRTLSRSSLTSAFLLAIAALAVPACTTDVGADVDGEALDRDESLGTAQGEWNVVLPKIPLPPPPVLPQSFQLATTWTADMTSDDGWGPAYPRMLGDMDGDGKKDLIGFGIHGVWVGRSTGSSFDVRWHLAELGGQQGWTTARHVRLVGDVSGDGRDDLVGFGEAGVYLSRSTGTSYGPATFVLADLGYNSGWRVESHTRLLADVDGDGKKDIVAYGRDGVWIARATGTGFQAPAFVLARFGTVHGFNPTRHVRTAADVNGDGREDLVVFADDGVYTALSTGAGFLAPTRVLAEMGYNQGWRVANHVRMLVDVNRDGKKDLVGFGDAGVYVARASTSGFGPMTFEIANFGTNQGFGSGRFRDVVDLNGDGHVDIVAVGPSSVWRALGGPNGFATPTEVLNDLSNYDGYGGSSTPVFAGDVNGDGRVDLIGLHSTAVRVARSTDAPLQAPPATPTNPRFTAVSSTSLTFAWTDASTDEIRFRLQYRQQGGSYTTVWRDPNTTTATYYGLQPSTSYCFRVEAIGNFTSSSYSPEVCTTTLASTGGGGGGGGSTPVSETRCGTSAGVCPAGYHAEQYVYSSMCGGNVGTKNAAQCVLNDNRPAFIACGIRTCPSGYHATEFIFTAGCDLSTQVPTTDDNTTTCGRDSSSFVACGGCPAGYSVTQIQNSPSCAPYSTVQCTK